MGVLAPQQRHKLHSVSTRKKNRRLRYCTTILLFGGRVADSETCLVCTFIAVFPESMRQDTVSCPKSTGYTLFCLISRSSRNERNNRAKGNGAPRASSHPSAVQLASVAKQYIDPLTCVLCAPHRKFLVQRLKLLFLESMIFRNLRASAGELTWKKIGEPSSHLVGVGVRVCSIIFCPRKRLVRDGLRPPSRGVENAADAKMKSRRPT